MKNYKVKVEDEKVKFFKELLSNLDFATFEELEETVEPRVYPAASFEIRSSKGESKSTHPDQTAAQAEERKKSAQSREDSLKDVLNKIEQMRNQGRK